MSTQSATQPAPAAARRAPKGKPAAEKQKPIGYVNWVVVDSNGDALLHSSKGFPLFDNEYLTRAERDLFNAAQANDGSVVLNAQLRISVARDETDRPDISGAIIPRNK